MTLGSLTTALEDFKDDAILAFSQYEGDEDVESLRERYILLRDRAENIQAGLAKINDGLSDL